MKKSLLSLTFLALAFNYSNIQAQSLVDNTFMISRDLTNGTARFKAMGGVNTALGGDISSISGNPAGLGFYGQSDASISLNYLNNENKTTYFGNSVNQTKGKLGLENIGVVIHYPTHNNTDFGWQNFNVGLSIDKQNNFNDNLKYSGTNNQNSIVHSYTDIMDEDAEFAGDFWNSYLVDKGAANSGRYFPTTLEADDKNQQMDLITTGYKYNTNVSFGANYGNKLYIGARFGFLSFNYDSKSTFLESGWTKTADEIKAENPTTDFAKPSNPAYQYTDITYDLTDINDLTLKGTGINAGLGIIYKPTWDWNIGVNITSPTWTEIQEDSNIETLVDYYKDANTTTSLHPGYGSKNYGQSFDYAVISPWKSSIGLTKFFGQGLISAEAEYINYASIKYREIVANADLQFESETNYQIKNSFKGAFNLKIGGELLITDQLAVRAGFHYLGSPYKYDSQDDYIASLGFGYVITQSLYIDLAAMQYKQFNYGNSPYSFKTWNTPTPTADVTNTRTNVVLTLGAKF
ncbi:hypothetical protein CHU00_08705 [Sphingobacterium cellulitidis]|uniref:OmpP1/FadL family transporter n=1 Tax=Sphingobacterium cellulitidis TaxID=1768011 RepID=UPI000B93EA64|nr:outer membrane protein transport protein [Sphingobacterium cellulitidis]OYD46223.1 hypothetical protein CHU00_08705 [Sphingobacterium cellulitidis]